MTSHIRIMQAKDIACILRIQEKCYTQLIHEPKEAFEKKRSLSPDTCFVATHANRIIGYLVALPRRLTALPALGVMHLADIDQPDCLHLHDLAVDPKMNGVGVGSALLGAFFSSMERLQLQCASLIAVQNAESYWRRQGFTIHQPEGESKQALLSYGEASYMMTYRR